MSTTILAGGNAAVTEAPTPIQIPITDEGIPQSFADPLTEDFNRPWIEAQDAQAQAKSEARRAYLEKLDSALLEPEKFFKQYPIDTTLVPDAEAEKRATLVRAFARLNNDGRPIPAGQFGQDLMRRDLAFRLFDGKGANSDDEFFSEMTKAAVKRKDTKNLVDQITVSAFDDAAMPTGEAKGWIATRDKLRTHAGWQQSWEADYQDTFNRVRDAAVARVDEFRGELDTVWKTFKTDGNVTAAAYGVWNTLPENKRGEFLDALAIRAKALPVQDQARFWSNMGKVTEQSLADFGRQAGEAAVSSSLALPANFYPGAVGGVIVPPSPSTVAKKEKLHADFQSMRNFAADVRQIAREDYDPLKSITGDKLGFWEDMAYKTPGVVMTSATMAIPYVGMPVMYFSQQGQAYEQARNRFKAQGMNDSDATNYAEALAPLIAIPQTALEKVEFGLWSRKMPMLSKAIDALGDQVANRLVRFAGKTLAIGAAETTTEVLQDLTQYAVEDLAAAVESDIPNVQWRGKGGVWDGEWAQVPEIFVTMLPLTLLGAAGGLSAEARAKAFADATPLQRRALGITEEASKGIDDAAKRGQSSLNQAVDEAWQTRDANTPEAKAAAAELKTTLEKQRAAAANLEKIGYAFPRITTLTDGTFAVHDGATGEQIGIGQTLADVERLAKGHTTALDNMRADHIAEMATILLSGQELAKTQGVETVFDLGKVFSLNEAAAQSPQAAERIAEELALIEQAGGGDGSMTMHVLGQHTTELRNGLRQDVNTVFAGGHLGTLLEETIHGKWRAARAAGIITRADDIALLRAFDQVLGDRKSKDGEHLRFIPDGMADEEVSETRIEEAIGQLGQMEIFRTAKGGKNKFNLPRAVVSSHIGAVGQITGQGLAFKFKSFMEAMRARMGLIMSRVAIMRKAEREGKFDRAGYDAYLNKVLGLDEQLSHDEKVRRELARIFAYTEQPGDNEIPFSIGKSTDGIHPKSLDEAKKIASSFVGKEIINQNDGFKAVVSSNSLRKILSESAVNKSLSIDAHAYAVANLDVLFESSLLSHSKPDERGNDHIKAIHRYFSPFLYHGEVVLAKITVKEFKHQSDGNRIYSVEALDVVKPAGNWVSKIQQEPQSTPQAGFEQKLIEKIDQVKGDSSFSLGPVKVADIMAGNALARVKDPIRRAQAMSRMARDFAKIRMDAERSLQLSKWKRGKGEMRREAALMEEMLAEQYVNDAYARHMGILTADDMTKIKSQPVHAYLADPDSHLRGRLMSKTAAIKRHPDMFQVHRAGDYDGADGISRSVFGGQLMPDQAAQELFDNHLIPAPTPDAMWHALSQEQNMVASMKEALSKAQESIREAKDKAKQEATDWLAKQVGDQSTNFSAKEEIIRSLQMLDAIMLALPPSIAGKLGGYTQISRIASDELRLEFLKEKIAKADVELEKFMKYEFGREFEELLKRTRPERDEAGKKPRGKIGANVHDLFRAVEDAMSWSGKEVQAEVDKLDALAANPDLTAAQVAHLQQEAGLINLAGNWTAANAARREAALLEATRIYFGGYMQRQIEISAKREATKARRDDLKQATGKAGVRMERVTKEIKDKGSKIGRVKTTVLSLYSFPQLLDAIFGKDSDTAKLLSEWEFRAARAKDDAITIAMDAIDALHSRLAGGSYKGEQLRWDLAQPGTVKVKTAQGVESMSMMQAVTASLMWQQEDGRRHMEGIIDEETGKVTSSWGWTQADMDDLEGQLTDEAKAIRFHLMDAYGGEYERLNEVFRGLYGVNMPRHALYSPISVKPSQSAGGQMADPVSGMMTGPSLTPGSLRNRSQTAVAEPDFKDALQVFIAHSKQMEHWMAYAPFATEAMSLVNSRDVGNSVEAAAGKEALHVLRGWMDYFAQGGTRDAGAHLAGNQMLARVIGRMSSAILVGRVGVLAIQSVQLAAGAYKMPVGVYLKQFARLMTGQLSWGTAIKSDYIQRRLRQMPPVVQMAMQGLASSKPNRVKFEMEKLGRLISGADALFTGGTYAMIYDWQLSINGGDAAAAALEAERITDTVAQPIRTGERSYFELTATNPMVKLIWAFASENRQKAALTMWEMQNGNAKSKAKTLAVTWLASGVLATIIRTIMRDIRTGGDDEVFDEKTWDIKRMGLMAMTGPLQGIPVVGDAMSASISKAFGVWMPQGNMFASISDAWQTANTVGDYFDGEKDMEETLKDAETLLMGIAAPVSGTGAAAASASHVVRDLYGIVSNLTE